MGERRGGTNGPGSRNRKLLPLGPQLRESRGNRRQRAQTGIQAAGIGQMSAVRAPVESLADRTDGWFGLQDVAHQMRRRKSDRADQKEQG